MRLVGIRVPDDLERWFIALTDVVDGVERVPREKHRIDLGANLATGLSETQRVTHLDMPVWDVIRSGAQNDGL